jgi:hypothetical protein
MWERDAREATMLCRHVAACLEVDAGLAAMLLHLNELFASGSATAMVREHS